MEKSKSLYCLLIYLVLSVSGRSLDNYNNETQYQCLTDDSCSQYDNIRLYNQKIFCCRPNHTIIIKLEMDNAVIESFSLQTGGGQEKNEETEQQTPKTESPQPKPGAVDSVTYSVVEVPNEREDGHHKSPSALPFTDEHFPTTLYFDLKKSLHGKPVKRQLNTGHDNFKVIKKLPEQAAANGRIINKRPPQTEAPPGRTRVTTVCVCDKSEPRSFMQFLLDFFQSLCPENWK